MKRTDTILVDLDGTLAKQEKVFRGISVIGQPIPAMVRRIKQWLKEGYKVKCFSARTHNNMRATRFVRQWLDRHGLHQVGITSVKAKDTLEIWDDRAVCVEWNTGRVLARNPRLVMSCGPSRKKDVS